MFSSVNDKLLGFRADTGEKLLELDLYTSQLGPPISFTIDGKQYISVAGRSAWRRRLRRRRGRTRCRERRSASACFPRPAHLLILTLDGNAPIPGAPAN